MVVALGLVVAVTLTAATVLAWGPGMGRGMGQGFGHGYGAVAAVPNLSVDQVAKIQKIQSDRYGEAETVRSEMYTKKTELQALFREPVLDQAKITAKQKEIRPFRTRCRRRGWPHEWPLRRSLPPSSGRNCRPVVPGPAVPAAEEWVSGTGGRQGGPRRDDRLSGDNHLLQEQRGHGECGVHRADGWKGRLTRGCM